MAFTGRDARVFVQPRVLVGPRVFVPPRPARVFVSPRVFVGPRVYYSPYDPGTYFYYAPYGGGAYSTEQGYRDGFDSGRGDARHGRAYDPESHGHFRDAISAAYRDGYLRGYDVGYHQYAG